MSDLQKTLKRPESGPLRQSSVIHAPHSSSSTWFYFQHLVSSAFGSLLLPELGLLHNRREKTVRLPASYCFGLHFWQQIPPAAGVQIQTFCLCYRSAPPGGAPGLGQGQGPSPPNVSFSSVALSCPTLGDLMDRSTPGLPVHHQLLEFTQTHVHRVSGAIQPSHPVVPFSSHLQPFPASGSFQMSQLFTSGGQSIGVSSSKISPSSEHSGRISFRMDWLDLLAVQGTLKSLLHKTVQKHQLFSTQLSLWSNSHIHT